MAGRGAGQQAKACGANGGPRKLRGPCLLPSTRKHGPRAQNRRDGAPKGDADHEAASHVALSFATCYPVAPIGAPFPSVFEGHPGNIRFARRRDADGAWAKQVSATLARDRKHRVVPANAGTHNLRSRGIRTAPASRLISAQRMGPCVRRDDPENGATAQPAMRPANTAPVARYSRQLFRSR